MRVMPVCPLMHGTGFMVGAGRADRRRQRRHHRQSAFRSARSVGDRRARARAEHGDRGRSVRAAAAARAGRKARPLRSQLRHGDDVVGRDVDRGCEARPRQPHPADFAGRQFRVHRSDGHGLVHHDERRRDADGGVQSWRERHRHRRERPADRARKRQGRACGAERSAAGRAITRIRRRPRRRSAPSAIGAIPFRAIMRAWKRTAR